jgi:glycosyltransferase involved in cell wall biosynthesis
MNNLSVVIITYNEQYNIGRCIDSVIDIADEIVIIDSFSTDRTKEISGSRGARFILHEFENYVDQKNFANAQAKFDYILSLDADEVLSEELKESIKQAKEKFSADGYTMNRLTNYAGKWVKHCGWYPDKKLRLFDRRKGSWEGLIIHEAFEMIKGSKVNHLSGDLLHYSFNSVEEHKRQSDKFTTLGAQADFQRGKTAPLYKIWLSPVIKFLQSYFIRLGFLDGKTGFTICRLSAFATYQKYSKLKEIHQQSPKHG